MAEAWGTWWRLGIRIPVTVTPEWLYCSLVPFPEEAPQRKLLPTLTPDGSSRPQSRTIWVSWMTEGNSPRVSMSRGSVWFSATSSEPACNGPCT